MLDAKNQYWKVKQSTLHPHLTPIRLIQIPVIAFWPQSQSRYLQIDKTYRKCRGVVGIADNIQIYSIDEVDHLHLYEAMENTRRADTKLNAEKCVIKAEECQFFEIKPEKVTATTKMKSPKDSSFL